MTDVTHLDLVEVDGNGEEVASLGFGSLIHQQFVVLRHPLSPRLSSPDAPTDRIRVTFGAGSRRVEGLHRIADDPADVVWGLCLSEVAPEEPVRLEGQDSDEPTALQVLRQHARDGSGVATGQPLGPPTWGPCDWFIPRPKCCVY